MLLRITHLGHSAPTALMQQRFQRFNRINYGAESEVLSGLLGICTVGLFCSLVGLFSPVAAEYGGAYLGSVTGRRGTSQKDPYLRELK